MINNFDPNQETLEEYLRRYHLKDNLNMEWKYGQDKEEKEKEEPRNFRQLDR